MKRLHRHRFNLIEILIALGILAIGMVAVLGLFPVGFATTRDAMAESSSADAADQMLHMWQYKLKTPSNWTKFIGGSDPTPTSPPNPTTGASTDSTAIPAAKQSQNNVITTQSWGASSTSAEWDLIEPFTAGCVIKDNTVPGLYKIIRFVHTTSDAIPSGLAKDEPFYDATQDILDFEAVAKVWKERFWVDSNNNNKRPPQYVGETGTNIDPAEDPAELLNYGRAVVLNLEISWPANQPDPAKRKKALYRLELFNGN